MVRNARAEPGSEFQVVVEIDRRAARSLDERLTRRLIELELNELDIQQALDEDRGASPERRSLFVRVLGDGEGQLRVELWEHGEFHGARIVALGDGTSEHLRARRIALTAASLGRRLRVVRLREAQLAAERARIEAQAQRAAETRPPPSRVALGVHGRAAMAGPGLWFAGPGLEGQLRYATGERLDLGLAWMTGTAPALEGKPAVQWLELSVAPGYAFAFAERLDFVAGLEVAASAVHIADVMAVDDTALQSDTWSARATGRFLFEWDLGPRAHLRLGSEAGAVVRRMPVVDRGGEDHRLGGVWVGGTLGVEFDPRAVGDPSSATAREHAPERLDAAPETDSPSAPRRDK